MLPDVPVTLSSYLGKVFLALVFFAVAAWAFLRFGRGRGWVQKENDMLRVISSLSLGRDVFFVLRCGPDVLGIMTGSGGAKLMGRWKYEEWNELEKDKKLAE